MQSNFHLSVLRKNNNNGSKVGIHLLISSFYHISNSLSITIYSFVCGKRPAEVLDELFSSQWWNDSQPSSN